MTTHEHDAMTRLRSAMDDAGTCACIGIDPVLDCLPNMLTMTAGTDLAHLRTFCMTVLNAIEGAVKIVKPQSACFERYGSAGYAMLEEVITAAKSKGFIVILDAKRGDIGSSAAHYALGAARMHADLITCSPYMGRSTIEPFLKANLGVFALCQTSNPDATEIQTPDLTSRVASMITELGDQVGAVVGATNNTQETKRLRALMPEAMFLVPGVGTQGGTIEDVRAMTRPNASKHSDLGVCINASRSVLYPTSNPNDSWQDAITRQAHAFADACRTLL